MKQDHKAKIGIIAAIGAVIGILAVIFHKFLPKMKECCQGNAGKCCGGHESDEHCCQDEK